MKSAWRLLTSLASAWLLEAIAVTPVYANVIYGSFTGIAVNVQGNPFTVQEGDTVYGHFSLDTSYPFEYGYGDGLSSVHFIYNGRPYSPDPVPPPPVIIALEEPAAGTSHYTQAYWDDVGFQRDATSQTLSIVSDGNAYVAYLTLVGADGAFFSSFDMASLHPGEVDLARSSARYASKGTLDYQVAFTRFAFDAMPVPEPGSLAVATTGLAALLLTTRRRRNKAS